MIELETTGVHFELNDKTKQYVNKKLGKLDKYVPRRQREGLRGTVILTEDEGRSKNRFTAEATLHLPHDTVTAKESTISIFAAVDIVEEKLKMQILKHKDKMQNNRQRRRGRRMMKGFRFSRRNGEE